jgi:hypothetical protein
MTFYQHPGKDGAVQSVRGENMSGEHRLKLFLRSLNRRLLEVDAGIVHENGDRGTGQPLCIADEDGSLVKVSDISGEIYRIAANRSYGSGELGFTPAYQYDLCASRGETRSDAQPQPGPTAGNQSYFSV